MEKEDVPLELDVEVLSAAEVEPRGVNVHMSPYPESEPSYCALKNGTCSVRNESSSNVAIFSGGIPARHELLARNATIKCLPSAHSVRARPVNLRVMDFIFELLVTFICSFPRSRALLLDPESRVVPS